MSINDTVSISDEIARLKKKHDAIILAHNYQLGEVQDVADFLGDSLDLSRKAADTEAKVIVFCGVYFMAETASILSPDKKVLLPDTRAGCRMADMITAEALRAKKKEHPQAAVVCYVNSTAEVKAESDICCTSANAVKIVKGLDAQEIIFVPDMFLGQYVERMTGRKMILWPGYCPTHARIHPEHITALKAQYPQARVMVHPECRPEVIDLADEVLSTSGMIAFAARPDISEVIVGTEIGIIHRLRKENPGKTFIPVSEQAVCPNMKIIDLDRVLHALQTMQPEVKVPEDIRIRAKRAVDNMLKASTQ